MRLPPTLVGRGLLAAMLVVGYAIVLIGGGHGVAPLCLLLVFGTAEDFYVAQLFGWLGIGLASVAALHPLSFRCLAPVAVLALALSMTVFITISEAIPFSIVTALPFVGAIVVVARNLGHVGRPRSTSTHP